MPTKQKTALSRKSPNHKRVDAHRAKQRLAFHYNSEEEYCALADIGHPDIQCSYCHSQRWKGETANFCCSTGRIILEDLPQPPSPLNKLLNENSPEANEFQQRIRSYNSILAMTSIGCNEVRYNFMPTFKICGHIYHRIGSLLPTPPMIQKFLQIYFVGDSAEEAKIRLQHHPDLNSLTMEKLQEMLHSNNTYIKEFKTAMERMRGKAPEEMRTAVKEHLFIE